MASTTKNDEAPETKTQVVEKRVGSAVIRRRREINVTPPPAASESVAPAVASTTPTAAAPTAVATPAAAQPKGPSTIIATQPVGAVRTTTTPAKVGVAGAATATPAAKPGEEEEATPAAKLKKPLRRKRSRDEWVEEDIRRAGGLRHYAEEDLVTVAGPVEEDAVAGPVAPLAAEEVEAAPEVPAVPEPVAPPVVVEAPVISAPSLPANFQYRPQTQGRMDRVFRPSGMRRKRTMRRDAKKPVMTEMKAAKRVIRVEEQIAIVELSQRMGVKATDLLKQLMGLGIMTTINQTVDIETATLLAHEYGFEIERGGIKEDQLLAAKAPISKTEALTETVSAKATLRPPVVTVMGHVDHGKTSILDAVRKTDVAAGEAGGITQHIGASEVTVQKGTITFLDTPGHEAFTALRARGAKVTDIVVLVVAADDGVMPQTKEAIDHAKAAAVPIIVAVNKMDKPDANPDRVKRQLAEHGVVPEDWGGDAACVPVSAKTGNGISDLLEQILLQAEVLELKADATMPASGTVIEAKLDKGRGPVVTVLLQSGTLRKGVPIVCGTCFGKVRALVNPRGQTIDSIGPGQAAEILGLNEVPSAGDAVIEATDERSAKLVAETRGRKLREEQQSKSVRLSLEDLHQQMQAGVRKELPVIIKADVQGSAEAVVAAMERLSTEQVSVNVIHHGVGGVSESDVMLAVASRAVVIAFNVTAEPKSRQLAEQEGIQISRYKIIYELIDDVKKAMTGLLEPQRIDKVLGRAQVREVFNITKVGTIAGCFVANGKIQRSARARLLRDSAIVFEGKVASLKRFKEDAREVLEGHECGIGLEGYQDIKPGDVIESYVIEEKAAELQSKA